LWSSVIDFVIDIFSTRVLNNVASRWQNVKRKSLRGAVHRACFGRERASLRTSFARCSLLAMMRENNSRAAVVELSASAEQ